MFITGIFVFLSLLPAQQDQKLRLGTPKFEHPHDPWVFRSVLDAQPRTIVVAMNQKMWLAFNTQTCQVSKLWKGGVTFEGEVYNSVPGPQPHTNQDRLYYQPLVDNPWTIKKGKEEFKPKVHYRGYRFGKNRTGKIYVAFLYDLILPPGKSWPDGMTIPMEEIPQFKEDPGVSMVLLTRQYNYPSLGKGLTIVLDINSTLPIDKQQMFGSGAMKNIAPKNTKIPQWVVTHKKDKGYNLLDMGWIYNE